MVFFKNFRSERKASTDEETLNLDLLCFRPSLSHQKHQVPAILTFAVASNTDVLNAIIKRVRA